jgi:excisionase family DNA binding protein
MTEKERKIRALKSHSEDALLSLAEVASQLGVSRGTVAQWVESRLVAYVRYPGGRRRVRQSTVDRIRTELEANEKPEEFYDQL